MRSLRLLIPYFGDYRINMANGSHWSNAPILGACLAGLPTFVLADPGQNIGIMQLRPDKPYGQLPHNDHLSVTNFK
jgi:hypothetical protein